MPSPSVDVLVEVPVSNQVRQQCDICRRTYSSQRTYRKHILRIHPDLYRTHEIIRIVECNNCGGKFSTRRALIYHIRTFHSEEIEARTLQRKIVKCFECNSCAKKFACRRTFISHWKNFHTSLILSEVKEKNLACNQCDKVYSHKSSLYKHKQLHHANSVESLEQKWKKTFVCDMCGTKYSYQRALRQHLRTSHPEEVIKQKMAKPFVCDVCGKRYTTKYYLAIHQKRSHFAAKKEKSTKRTLADYKCSVCRNSFVGRNKLLQHFAQDHRIRLTPEFVYFDQRAHFDEWLVRVETSSKCSFSVRSSNAYGDGRFVVYECSRSGRYASKAAGMRAAKLLGSKKIGTFCPAEIRLKITSSDQCTVRFVSTHVGYTNTLGRMRLNDLERRSIAAQLDAGTSVSGILQKFVVSATNDTERTRLNVVNANDVRNVRKKMALGAWNCASKASTASKPHVGVQSDASGVGATNLDAWIAQNVDSLLYVKRKGDTPGCGADAILTRDDCLFIMMTRQQRARAAEYGRDVVCVRHVLRIREYGIHVNALLVTLRGAQHSQCGYVCAFTLSNRNDAEMCGLLVRMVRRAVPALQPRVVVAPVGDAWDSACAETIGEADGGAGARRLYCVWQVLRTWRRQASRLVRDASRRTLLQRHFERLLYESQEERFARAYDALMAQLDDENAFKAFFDAHYGRRVESWAYCRAGVDANAAQEAFYREFNFSTLLRRRRRSNRMCCDENMGHCASRSSGDEQAVLDILVRVGNLNSRRECEEILAAERGLIKTHLRSVRSRHRKTVFDFQNVRSDESGARWLVTSPSDVVCHVSVVDGRQSSGCCVGCQLLCEPCAACSHQYECSCDDARLRRNMCTHVHLVCQYRIRVESRVTGQAADTTSVPPSNDQADQMERVDDMASAD